VKPLQKFPNIPKTKIKKLKSKMIQDIAKYAHKKKIPNIPYYSTKSKKSYNSREIKNF
jgi:hypothetical protein